jgi:hypothetical protein
MVQLNASMFAADHGTSIKVLPEISVPLCRQSCLDEDEKRNEASADSSVTKGIKPTTGIWFKISNPDIGFPLVMSRTWVLSSHSAQAPFVRNSRPANASCRRLGIGLGAD